MGSFGNEYVANLSILVPLIMGTVIGLPVFGYFYNKLMDSLGEREHTSLYVVGGVLVTILVGALFSWKSAILFLILFALDGAFMVIGDFKRSFRKEKKTQRRKRMPYAANGLIEDIRDAAVRMNKLTGEMLQSGDAKELGKLQHQLTTVLLRVDELKNIQEK